MTQHERELFEEHREEDRQRCYNYVVDHLETRTWLPRGLPVPSLNGQSRCYTLTEYKGHRLGRCRRASLATYQQDKTGGRA